MANCYFCGSEIPYGAGICPMCGRVQQLQPSDTYSNAVNNYDNYMKSEYYRAKKDASTAKALGIISIVCAIISTFVVAGVVCGIIGIIKSKSAMEHAQQSADITMFNDAKSSRTLNIIGLVISGVIVLLAILAYILFFVLAISYS